MASKTVIALGNFDGVHIAHQEILKNTKYIAQKSAAKSIVITFDPHPQKVLGINKYRAILPLHVRTELIKKHGINEVIVIEFNHEFSKIEATNFIQDKLLQQYNAGWIVSGYDCSFGHKKSGSAALLYQMSKTHHFSYQQVCKIKQNGLDISSSAIKSFLEMGAIGIVSEMLGRAYHPYFKGYELLTNPRQLLLYYDSNYHYPADGSYIAKIKNNGIEKDGILECDSTINQAIFTWPDDEDLHIQNNYFTIALYALLNPKRHYLNNAIVAKQAAINFQLVKYFFRHH